MLTLKLCFRLWIIWQQMLWLSNQINLPVHTNTNISKYSNAELSFLTCHSQDQIVFKQDIWKRITRNPEVGGRTFRYRSLWPLTYYINLNLTWAQKNELRSSLRAKVVTHWNLDWPRPKALLQQVRSQHALSFLVRLRHPLQQKRQNEMEIIQQKLTAKSGLNINVKA